MLTINKILCPVDFSDQSRNTLHYAAEFARNSGAEIMLLHVLPLAYVLPYDAYTVPLSTLDESKEAAAKELDILAREITVEIDESKVSKVLITGNPPDEIVMKAKEWNADLIIVASHGRTGLKRLLLGSVAELVLREAECPVLVIKSDESAQIV